MRETGHENIRRTLECSGLFKTSVFFRACLNGGGGPQVGEVTRKNKTRLLAILQPRGAGVVFLEIAVALTIKEFEQRRPKLTSRKRRKIKSRTIRIYSGKRHALCSAVFGFARDR